MSFNLDPSIRPQPSEFGYEKNLVLYNSIAKSYADVPATLKAISDVFEIYNKLLEEHEQNRKKLETIEPDFAMEYMRSSILEKFDRHQIETDLNRKIKVLSEKTKALPKVIANDVTKVGVNRALLLMETSSYLGNVLNDFKKVLQELKSDSRHLALEIKTQNSLLEE